MNTEKTLKEPPLSLSQAWEEEAQRWAIWARKPGHDSYWQFHRDQFFTLLPEPGMLTVDVGCGEGRVTRDLKRLGHKMIGIDASATLIGLAREEDPKGKYFHAPASRKARSRSGNSPKDRSPSVPLPEIDERVHAFLDRPLAGEWPYLWLDATYLKQREGGRIVAVAAIIAVAVEQRR
jgi:SAM-dependent methyltransferase